MKSKQKPTTDMKRLGAPQPSGILISFICLWCDLDENVIAELMTVTMGLSAINQNER